jgi:hypothetical protein
MEELCIRIETLEIFAKGLHSFMDELMKYNVALCDMNGMGALVPRRTAAILSRRRGRMMEPTPPPSTFLSAEGSVHVDKWTGLRSEELKRRWSDLIQGPDEPELGFYVVEATWRKV